MICLLIKRKNCNTPTSILQSGRTITFPTLALSKSGNGLIYTNKFLFLFNDNDQNQFFYFIGLSSEGLKCS